MATSDVTMRRTMASPFRAQWTISLHQIDFILCYLPYFVIMSGIYIYIILCILYIYLSISLTSSLWVVYIYIYTYTHIYMCVCVYTHTRGDIDHYPLAKGYFCQWQPTSCHVATSLCPEKMTKQLASPLHNDIHQVWKYDHTNRMAQNESLHHIDR